MTGTDIVHVPYKGSPQAINDLMAGNIQVMFDNVPSIGPHAKAGRVRGSGRVGAEARRAIPRPADDRRGGAGLRDQFVGRGDRTGEAAQGDCDPD